MSTSTATTVREIGFVVPLLPGRTERDRDAMSSCWHGRRRAAHAASRARLGITAESVWIQRTPAGDLAVVHMQADDVEAALERMGTSDDPFDRWFASHVREVHGIDLAEPLPPLEQVLAFRR
jgi:hypothetical protein